LPPRVDIGTIAFRVRSGNSPLRSRYLRIAPPVAAMPQQAAPVLQPVKSEVAPPAPARPRSQVQPKAQSARPVSVPAQPKLRPAPAPAPPPPKPCPACGRPNKPGARFCAGCGRSFVPLQPAILRIVEPVRAAWEMPVARSPMLLGRASQAEGYWPDFDMTFYDEDEGFVSRRHAQISRGPDGYSITDLDSYNGTTVNGQPLLPQRAYPLRNGDRIQVGLVVIEFRLR